MQRYNFFLIYANFLKTIFTNRAFFFIFIQIRDFGVPISAISHKKEDCANHCTCIRSKYRADLMPNVRMILFALRATPTQLHVLVIFWVQKIVVFDHGRDKKILFFCL